MPKAYSADLRLRVLAAYDQKIRVADIAERFQVKPWWIHKMVRQRKQIGSIDVLPRSGRPRKLANKEAELRKLIEEDPSATLRELRDKLGLQVSLMTLWRVLQKMRLTLKKSPARNRAKTA
jgi:transposase